MPTPQQNFLAWLRDAHAMEKQALTMLGRQLARLDRYPALKDRVQLHRSETETQIAVLRGLLDRQAGTRSRLKDIAGRVTAAGQALGAKFAADEVVKAALAGYAFEHLEIATYRVLIATAQELDDAYAVTALTGILEQETGMADWLQAHLPELTRSFLRDSAAEGPPPG